MNELKSREILDSTVCGCGKGKNPQLAFCAPCYKSLPADLRPGLRKPVGRLFISAYKNAKKYLTLEVWK